MTPSEFQFINPILSNLNYKLHSEFDKGGNESLLITPRFNTDIQRDTDNPRAIVEFTVVIGDMDPQLSPFFIELTVSSLFVWKDSLSEEVITTFLSENAPAVLLSYARPIVSSITNMGPYAPYTIPFFNFAASETSSEAVNPESD